MRKTLASSVKTVSQAFRSFQSLLQLHPERSSCFFNPSIPCMAENSSDGSFSKWVCEDSAIQLHCKIFGGFFTAKGKRKWCPPVTFSAPTSQFHSLSWKHFYPLGVLRLCIYPLCKKMPSVCSEEGSVGSIRRFLFPLRFGNNLSCTFGFVSPTNNPVHPLTDPESGCKWAGFKFLWQHLSPVQRDQAHFPIWQDAASAEKRLP